jgi:hypothetical protein
MAFLGQEIVKNFPIYQGKVKVLTYSAGVGDLMFSMRLEDTGMADYHAIEISETVQSQTDQIVALSRDDDWAIESV